tara:strand:- start:5378 stop:5842 length:465 start_codon:yes stop_codon:yes gene_type:complete
MKTIVLSLYLTCLSYTQAASNVTWDLVEAIRQVESGGRNVTGDNGMARGQWQFWSIAWKDVNQYRSKFKLMTYSYDFAWKENVARVYAHDLLEIIRSRFIKRLNREPSVSELWCIWNLGHKTYFDKYKGDITKCPKSTIRNAMVIEAALRNKQK